MSIFSKFFLALVLVIGLSGIVKADPVRIISGTASTSRANFDFTTGESTFKGSQTVGLSTELYYQNFLPGSVFIPIVNLINVRGDLTGFQNSFRGTATINGVFFDRAFFGNFYGNSSLIFTSTQPIQFPGTILQTFSVQIPFTMQGTLRGSQCINFVCTSLPESYLYGSGDATYYFYQSNRGEFQFWKADYVFTTPEPTPEPATILLLGTGLAGIFGYARRRKKLKS